MTNTTIKLLASMVGREGQKVSLFYNRKLIKRRVYFRRDCGLYIIINNRMYFEYELPQGEEVTFEDADMAQKVSEGTEDIIKINFSLSALKAKRDELARIQLKEYQTRGNTQRCQELWAQIEKIDAEIARR